MFALVPAALGAWLILFTVLKVTHPITGELMAVISAEPLSAEDYLYVVLCLQCVAMSMCVAPGLTTTRCWLGGRYLKRWRIFTVTVAVVITLLYLINFIFGVLIQSKDLFADRPAFNGACTCDDHGPACYAKEWLRHRLWPLQGVVGETHLQLACACVCLCRVSRLLPWRWTPVSLHQTAHSVLATALQGSKAERSVCPPHSYHFVLLYLQAICIRLHAHCC